MTEIVAGAGQKLDVIMVPKVEGPWDIHYMDQFLALLEARHGVKKPIMLHAILETAEGVANVEAICGASPRMHGISLGPADLAASRKMKTTRVGGGHPGYRVIEDPRADGPRAGRCSRIFGTIRSRAWSTPARSMGSNHSTARSARLTIRKRGEQQFRNAYLMGCAGAWTLHPSQVAIAKKVFNPDVEEVLFAKKILAAMPDGQAWR